MSNPHYMLLMEISSELSRQDLRNLIFCCGDVISEAEAEKIESGVDLFKALKHQDRLKPDQYDFLKKLLKTVGRVDLAEKLPCLLKTVLSRVPSYKKSVFLSSKKKKVPSLSIKAENEDEVPVSGTSNSRVVLLQIAEHLSTEDTSKLAFLFADKLSLNRGERMKGTELLWQLETAGVIDPSQPETLAESLHVIGRKDLASLYVSMQSPQSILSSLNTSHQLLNIKISMLTKKRSHYSFQRKVMLALLRCDRTTMAEMIIKPVTQRSIGFYEYSFVHRLYMDSLSSAQKTKDLGRAIVSTLPEVFDFNYAYFDACYHYIIDSNIDMCAIKLCFQQCRDCFEKFQDAINISEIQWNDGFRSEIKAEITERRTPTGSPGHKAVECIHQVCSELCGGSEITSAMKDVDEGLYALESIHYAHCYRVILTQWLETILGMLSHDSVSLPFDPSLLRATLLGIVTKYQDQIGYIYEEISSVIGKDITNEISERLYKDGIIINKKISLSDLEDGDAIEYGRKLSLSLFTYLLLLFQFSCLKSFSINYSEIFSRLKKFNHETYRNTVPSSITLIKNMAGQYEIHVDRFRDIALNYNPLCTPVIEKIISHDMPA